MELPAAADLGLDRFPSSGLVVKALRSAHSRSQQLHERQNACLHLHQRFHQTLLLINTRSAANELPPDFRLSKFTAVLNRFRRLLEQHGRLRDIVRRLLATRRFLTGLRRVHAELSTLIEEWKLLENADLSSSNVQVLVYWENAMRDAQDKDDRRLQEILAAQLATPTFVRKEFGHSPRKQTQVLMELLCEFAPERQRSAMHSPRTLESLKTAHKRISILCDRHVRRVPRWFLPSHEIEFSTNPEYSLGHSSLASGTLRSTLQQGEFYRPEVLQSVRNDGTGAKPVGTSSVVVKCLWALQQLPFDWIEQVLSQWGPQWWVAKHAHLVTIRGASHVTNPPYIVRDYMPQGDLLAYLQPLRVCIQAQEKEPVMHRSSSAPILSRTLPVAGSSTINRTKEQRSLEKATWRLLYEAGKGLRHLHDHLHVVHGGLRCSNVLVSNHGRAALADHGMRALRLQVYHLLPSLDKAAPEAAQKVARRVELKDDDELIRWLAPEAIRNSTSISRSLTYAADVYAFGMCILEAVTGRPPWDGIDLSDVRMLKTEKRVLPPRPDGVGNTTWTLVTRMCHEDPLKRLSLRIVVETLKRLTTESRPSLMPSASKGPSASLPEESSATSDSSSSKNSFKRSESAATVDEESSSQLEDSIVSVDRVSGKASSRSSRNPSNVRASERNTELSEERISEEDDNVFSTALETPAKEEEPEPPQSPPSKLDMSDLEETDCSSPDEANAIGQVNVKKEETRGRGLSTTMKSSSHAASAANVLERTVLRSSSASLKASKVKAKDVPKADAAADKAITASQHASNADGDLTSHHLVPDEDLPPTKRTNHRSDYPSPESKIPVTQRVEEALLLTGDGENNVAFIASGVDLGTTGEVMQSMGCDTAARFFRNSTLLRPTVLTAQYATAETENEMDEGSFDVSSEDSYSSAHDEEEDEKTAQMKDIQDKLDDLRSEQLNAAEVESTLQALLRTSISESAEWMIDRGAVYVLQQTVRRDHGLGKNTLLSLRLLKSITDIRPTFMDRLVENECVEMLLAVLEQHPSREGVDVAAGFLLDLLVASDEAKRQMWSLDGIGVVEACSQIDQRLMQELKAVMAKHKRGEGAKLAEEGDYEQAVQKYTEAIALDRRRPAYYCERCVAYMKAGNHKKAAEDATRAMRYNPYDVTGYLYHGMAMKGLGRYRDALKSLRKAQQVNPDEGRIETEMREVKELSTGRPAGNQAARLKRIEQAKQKKAEGDEMLRKRKYSLAIQHYTEAIQLDKENGWIFLHRSIAHAGCGQYQASADDASASIKLNYRQVEGYYRLALALHALKQYDEALECLYRGLEVDPNHSGIVRLISQLEGDAAERAGLSDAAWAKEKGYRAFQLRSYEEAIRFYTKALETLESGDQSNPSDEDMELARHCYFYRARANQCRGAFAAVVMDCSHLLRENPQHVLARLRRADAYEQQKEYYLALEDVKEIVKEHPEYSDAKERQVVLERKCRLLPPN